MQPLSDSSSSSFGTADLVGLAVDRHLTEQQALLSGPGMDHMQRRLARDAIERAPQRLAVSGHHPRKVSAKRCMKRLKQVSNAFGSSRRNTRLKVSWLGVP